uniref:Uncharacterized protein n=1 Tax=Myoviridae sp. ctZhr26 TaxID=2827694 RepID=A0A8S5T8A1_9CAUD|nr:MAG TPA: hypothetical protein [Myoviridae sp. ctZhr26]
MANIYRPARKGGWFNSGTCWFKIAVCWFSVGSIIRHKPYVKQ